MPQTHEMNGEPSHSQNSNVYIFSKGHGATAVLNFEVDRRDVWEWIGIMQKDLYDV